MSERSAPSEPPLILNHGRFIVYADGEYQAFYGPGNCSWTTGTLDSRDIRQPRDYLVAVDDNSTHMWEDVK